MPSPDKRISTLLSTLRRAALIGVFSMPLAGCLGFGGDDTAKIQPVTGAEYNDYRNSPGSGTLFGGSGLVQGPAKDNRQQEEGAALGVNAYLWRGALDTLSFMPLASADPFGGVIITDWYTPPTVTGERFKATAYILGRELRADGVKIAVFRQVQDGATWADAPVNPGTTTEIENKVLARARELRAQASAAR
jgi:hypothetical protein